MKYVITSLVLATLIGIIGSPFVVFGQESSDTFLAISDDETLSEEERFAKAKEGIILALTLANEKVAELTLSLENREFDENGRENELKNSFLESLSEYGLYYSTTLEGAETLTTLEDTQTLAQEVKDYRDTIYSPEVENIVQFILVFYSEDVINIASERFEKISEDIETLESLGLIEKDKFNNQLGDVSSLLEEASNLRNEAKDMILAAPHNEDEAITTDEVIEASTTAEMEIPTGTETDVDEENIITDTIKKSLNDVKAVYEIFLEISGVVKETLGLN